MAASGRIFVAAFIVVALLLAVTVESRSGRMRGSGSGKAAAKGSSVKDAASNYAKGAIADAASDIVSNAGSDAMIGVADKYMEKADAADSPETAAVDEKDAVQSVVSALGNAFKKIKGSASASPENDDAAKLANAIVAHAPSKAHMEAADRYIKEAAVADSPEKAVVAKKAAAENIAAVIAYAVAPTAAPTAAADKPV